MYCVARGKIRDRNSSEEPMRTWLMEQERQREAREPVGFSVVDMGLRERLKPQVILKGCLGCGEG